MPVQQTDKIYLFALVLLQIFSGGKFSQIVNMNREEEPAATEKLAMKLQEHFTKCCRPFSKLVGYFKKDIAVIRAKFFIGPPFQFGSAIQTVIHD